jgi:hypothetical protein
VVLNSQVQNCGKDAEIDQTYQQEPWMAEYALKHLLDGSYQLIRTSENH